jgi:4-hydroxy-tetrahydrodipicolinate reductase
MSAMPLDSANGRHRVAVVGLGKLGLLFVERLARRSDMDLVGVVDVSPEKAGRPLDEVAGRPTGFDLVVADSLEAIASADVALVATASRLHAVLEQLEELSELGLHTVSTCEELAYPWREFPDESRRVDEVARAHGVSIVGCGSNPGFLMDLLPSVFAFGCERVDSIAIERTLDMRPHRRERLTRFGLGVTPEEFDALEEKPTGHVGFTQSIDCVADALGWDLDRRVESEVRPAIFASDARSGTHVSLGPGTVAVIEHSARGYRDGETVIELRSYFGFHDASDPIFHGDVYTLETTDHPIRIEMAPSWSPFTGTPSTVVNMVGPIRAAAPGLRCTLDFPARSLAASGRGVSARSSLPSDNYLVSTRDDRVAQT